MKMKKLITMLVMIVGMLSLTNANAQHGSPATLPLVAGDSLATADTVFKKIPVTGGYNSLGIQVSIKKGTGTLDGKFYLYTSVNGQSYVLTDSASFSAVPTAALISNGGYTHTAIIMKDAPAGSSYLVAATQTGSLTSSPVKVSYTSRRYN